MLFDGNFHFITPLIDKNIIAIRKELEKLRVWYFSYLYTPDALEESHYPLSIRCHCIQRC